MMLSFTAYDIQTPYKSAVYSVKLKMEFTVLNALMDLVKPDPADHVNSPHAHSKSYHSGRATSLRPGVKSSIPHRELGHSIGTYSRMDDLVSTPQSTNIRLHNLRNSDGVLKSIATEARHENLDDSESFGSDVQGKGSRKSNSSEMHIIEPDGP